MPASEFQIVRDGKAYRVSLNGGNWFYLAGVWRPASGAWPDAFAILTVEAKPDVARYQPRQGAIVLRHRRMDWLDHLVPEGELLQPLPRGMLSVEPELASAQLGLSL